MQKVHMLLLCAIAFLSATCSSPKETAGDSKQKPTGKSFQKVFFVVASMDIQERVRLENDLVASAASGGYAAVRSLDMIPFSLNEPKIPAKEEINLKAKESGCDAVLIVSILRKEDAVAVTKGIDNKGSDQMIAGILGGILNKNGTNTGTIPGVYRPASYSLEKGFFVIKSFLYDVATETIMYSGESPSFEISSLDKKRKEYTATLITQLEKEKLLRK